MTRDTTAPPSADDESTEVMASVDTGGTVHRLVIADITSDETWVSVPTDASISLRDWC